MEKWCSYLPKLSGIYSLILSLLLSINLCVTQSLSFPILSGG